MNRLVIIGNGFDLAHGLKTRYEHFIDWYWDQWGERLLRCSDNHISDGFCSFKLNKVGIRDWYLVRDWYFKKRNMSANEFVHRVMNDTELCEFKITSYFLERINANIEAKGWVDIETIYYELLIRIVGNTFIRGLRDFKTLNWQLTTLKEQLIKYLKLEEEKGCFMHNEIKDKIYRPIKEREIAISYGTPHENLSPINVLMLNFNYTKTPQMYSEDNSSINYIHGMLKEPKSVIFGYGDELDENYTKLQNLNDNECLRNIKSIRYLELDCYRNVLRFIESDPFQICIMGHSCGNSDRTLLNTLFEHRNCVSIKPYYYQRNDGSDNYNELVMNISRNFTDRKKLRDRVVCKEYTEPLINQGNSI